jgi:hypothetical protein
MFECTSAEIFFESIFHGGTMGVGPITNKPQELPRNPNNAAAALGVFRALLSELSQKAKFDSLTDANRAGLEQLAQLAAQVGAAGTSQSELQPITPVKDGSIDLLA